MITPLCALVTVFVLMALLHAAVHDPKPLEVTVRPTVSFAPARLAIQVRLQPDDSDRWINVAMDNGDYRRTSGVTIEPDRKLYLVSWPGVPAGEYVIVAAVGQGSQTRATASAHVVVSGQ
jgi:hypothetical protein